MSKTIFQIARIKKWCDKLNLKNYVIDGETGYVNILSDGVDISHKNLGKIPIQFGIVNGNFSCCFCNLVTLKGSPIEITNGFFDCSFNKLTSFEGGPNKIQGNFFCSNNPFYKEFFKFSNCNSSSDIIQIGHYDNYRRHIKLNKLLNGLEK
jgi:hypothetical protein